MFRKQQIITGLQNKSGIKVFVETGTFMGDMTVAQSGFFDKLYTVELGEELYRNAKKRFLAFPNIFGLLGDSSKVLSTIIKDLNQPAIFWLDGHYSGGITAKGDLICPIYGELDAIISGAQFKHILCIDDARLFNGRDDYPLVEDLKVYIKFKGIKFDFKILDDIMIIKII